jgi:hypothetical protein
MSGAVFTIVQDEPECFPRWLAHYQTAFNADSIYVLYHAIPGEHHQEASWLYPDSNDDLGYWLLPVTNDLSFSHTWIQETVSKFQSFLLQSHPWVLFAASDELVMPRADLARLSEMEPLISDRLSGGPEAITCDGFEIVHRRAADALIPGSQITDQRREWQPSSLYSKTLVSRVPMRWDLGFHRPLDGCPSPEPSGDLVLVHLHRADFATALARHRRRLSRRWDRNDVIEGRGRQSRIVDEAALWNWIDPPGTPVPSFQPIPSAYLGRF